MYRADRGEREFQNLIGEAPLEALADIRAAWPDMYEAVVITAIREATSNGNPRHSRICLVGTAGELPGDLLARCPGTGPMGGQRARRRPGPGANSDALDAGAHRRLLPTGRHAMAARRRGHRSDQCQVSVARPVLDALADAGAAGSASCTSSPVHGQI